MDAEITLLAGTAGTTIAALLATDTWNGVPNSVITLWRRVRPDHEEQVAAQLDALRRDLLGAQHDGDVVESEAKARPLGPWTKHREGPSSRRPLSGAG
ncbi:hypothetical protein [Streptomyces sp. NPDC059783]|uniref:hypothetical protein n=1 Tax=Streptomyces sp. NPDC059783 TaxID=3346944 RepID=UPI0036565C1F